MTTITLGAIARKTKAQTDPTLVLIPKLARWYASHDELQFKPEHVDRVAELLRNEAPMSRVGRFGPSGRGSCPRQQVFSYLGMPTLNIGGGLKNVFWSGHHIHMINQLILLDAGLVDEIEVEVWRPDLRSGGRMDAVKWGQYGVDIKSTSMSTSQLREAWDIVLRWLKSRDMEFPEDVFWGAKHVFKAMLQVSSYMALEGTLPLFVLLYHVKTSGDDGGPPPLHEIQIQRWAKAMDFVEAEVEYINEHVDRMELPPMLGNCTMHTGKAYEDCAYKHICAQAQWPQRSVTVNI